MADTMKFRKKPVVIQAIRWDGTLSGMDEILSAFPDIRTVAKTAHPPTNTCSFWKIGTLEGSHDVSAGDFIIRGVKGEYYPCKPDIFSMTYEPAEATPQADAARGVEIARQFQFEPFTSEDIERLEPKMNALGATLKEPADAALADEWILQAVARGWCSKANAHKEIDATLADAIATELAAALRARAVPEVDPFGHDAELCVELQSLDTEIGYRAASRIGQLALLAASQSATGGAR